MTKKKINIIIEQTNTGFSAYSEDMNGIATTGKTIEEIKTNIEEVLNHQIEYLNETGSVESFREDFELIYQN